MNIVIKSKPSSRTSYEHMCKLTHYVGLNTLWSDCHRINNRIFTVTSLSDKTRRMRCVCNQPIKAFVFLPRVKRILRFITTQTVSCNYDLRALFCVCYINDLPALSCVCYVNDLRTLFCVCYINDLRTLFCVCYINDLRTLFCVCYINDLRTLFCLLH